MRSNKNNLALLKSILLSLAICYAAVSFAAGGRYDNATAVTYADQNDFVSLGLDGNYAYRIFRFEGGNRVALIADWQYIGSRWINKNTLCRGDCERRTTVTRLGQCC